MNRSILIIICDFLLVTLVAFSNFDADKTEQPAARVPAEARSASGNQDLVGTLKLVLEDGRAGWVLGWVPRRDRGSLARRGLLAQTCWMRQRSPGNFLGQMVPWVLNNSLWVEGFVVPTLD